MKLNKKLQFSILSFAAFFILALLPAVTLAASPSAPLAAAGDLCPGPDVEIDKDSGLCLPKSQFKNGIASSKSLTDLIGKVVKILLTLSGVIAVVFVVIGGFQYVTSGGNEELAEKGKKTLINAAIGLVVIVLAYALVKILVDAITQNTLIK